MKFVLLKNIYPCSGKTYPSLVLPEILDIMRERFHHNIPKETRVLLIVPLVNIFYSLEVDLIKFDIPYQFLTAGAGSIVNPSAKVVVTSPEKLLEKSTLRSIKSLGWSAICLDEPHLALGKFQNKSQISYLNHKKVRHTPSNKCHNET